MWAQKGLKRYSPKSIIIITIIIHILLLSYIFLHSVYSNTLKKTLFRFTKYNYNNTKIFSQSLYLITPKANALYPYGWFNINNQVVN